MESADGLTEFKKYKVINSPKVCEDKLCSEMDEKIAKKGESSYNINVCRDRLCSDFSDDVKTLNKSSPFGQLKLGIAIDLIQCKEGQEIVVKKTKQTPACVNSDNVEKLRERGWTITQKMQEEMFEKIASNRMQGLESSETMEDFGATITITPEEIGNKRYLVFNGEGWHRLHSVEITISGETFTESIRTKTNDGGHLNMPWSIPDNIPREMYTIFATDGIHEFEITIPVASSLDA